MNYRLICKVIGVILGLECLIMLVSIAVSLLYREQYMAMAFLRSIAVCGACAAALLIAGWRGENSKMHVREGFLSVSMSWIAMSASARCPIGSAAAFCRRWTRCLNPFPASPPPALR